MHLHYMAVEFGEPLQHACTRKDKHLYDTHRGQSRFNIYFNLMVTLLRSPWFDKNEIELTLVRLK